MRRFESTRDGLGWAAGMTCSAAPVQIEGVVDGLPFYFRARFQHWTFSVAETADGSAVDVDCGYAPGFHIDEPYGDSGQFTASWMEDDVAWRCVEDSIARFRATRRA